MTSQEEIRSYLENKLNQGFQVIDKNSFTELRKLAIQDLNLTKGHYSMINKVLLDVLKERNVTVLDLKTSEKVGNLEVQTPTPEPRPVQETIPPPQPTPDQMRGQEPPKQPEPPKPQLTEDDKKYNQEAFGEMFGFVGEIYKGLGLVKVKDAPKHLVEELSEEEFNKQVKEYGVKIGDFCYRHGVKVPFVVEVLSIAGTGFTIFGLPLLKTFLLPTETRPNEDLKDQKGRIQK